MKLFSKPFISSFMTFAEVMINKYSIFWSKYLNEKSKMKLKKIHCQRSLLIRWQCLRHIVSYRIISYHIISLNGHVWHMFCKSQFVLLICNLSSIPLCFKCYKPYHIDYKSLEQKLYALDKTIFVFLFFRIIALLSDAQVVHAQKWKFSLTISHMVSIYCKQYIVPYRSTCCCCNFGVDVGEMVIC